MNAVVKQ
jgi:hypothetical protein